MKKLIFLLLLMTSWTAQSQIYWSKQVDLDMMQHEYASCIGLADDGNLVIGGGGITLPPVSLRTNIYGKLNAADGTDIYLKSFPVIGGITNLLVSTDAKSTIFEGPFVDSITSLNGQILLTKILNQSGEIIWNSDIGLADRSEFPHYRFRRSSSGKLLLVGQEAAAVAEDYAKISFVMADAEGFLVFSKRYSLDTLVNHFGLSVIETPDKGFLIVAFNKYDLTITFHSIRDMIILKTDSAGNLVNSHTYPAFLSNCHRGYLGLDIARKQDGNYLICGYRDYECPIAHNFSNYIFATIDENGVLLDSTSSGLNFNCDARRLIPLHDGNFLACGYERFHGSDPKYGMLMKVSPDMKILWKRLYRTSPPQFTEHDQFYDVVEMPDDHGFVLVSASNLGDSTQQNGWVIRVDSLGCLVPGCDSLVAIDDLPGIDPDRPGELLVFPNPTGGHLTIELPEKEGVIQSYRVSDARGRVIDDVQFLKSARVRRFEINLGSQAAGVYFVSVRTAAGWLSKQIIKT